MVQDKAGSSAAAVAAYGGHVDCVARVLDSTAIASDRGMSALHLAVQVLCLILTAHYRPLYMLLKLHYWENYESLIVASSRAVQECCSTMVN